MLKKITLAMLAASAATAVYAQDANTGSADNQTVQAQIAELKKEIAALQASQEAMAKSAPTQTQHGSVESVDTGTDSSDHVTVPTNMGQIQNFLFSDVHDGVIPMGMLSSSQFALGLLKQRNMYSDRALVFGGYLEADPQVWHGSPITYNKGTSSNPDYQTYQSGKGLPITTANLYVAANLGRYVTAETTLAADSSDGYKVNAQDAFVMFGNLDDFPLYATVGKNRLAFGSFSGGGPWTGSLTQMLFRPGRVNNVSLAYYKDGLSSNLTLFQTDDHTSDFVYAAFYGNEIGKLAYGINGGYVYNVNGTGNSSFNLATNPGPSKTRIGAVNFDTSLAYDIYGVGAGWAQTTNKSDMTNNGYAGAWYVQAGFSPEIYGRSTNFNIAYNGAYNTNNLPITLSGNADKGYGTTSGATSSNNYKVIYPGSGVDKMIVASAQRPFFTENVLIGLEYAYMHMYNNQHTNAYTLDISVYF
ncbi:LbtU family siderophore porin [Cysteiniphilum sp. JM-1]|uniref:LbtU family siderophore porin n=1 Tax=Cysteiniphilum sp. JM-1 TaxID=2610891 RepID=UPI001245D17A|nr:LbtU family siderophore porin [Cysteiniphilum sp. JM-1]